MDWLLHWWYFLGILGDLFVSMWLLGLGRCSLFGFGSLPSGAGAGGASSSSNDRGSGSGSISGGGGGGGGGDSTSLTLLGELFSDGQDLDGAFWRPNVVPESFFATPRHYMLYLPLCMRFLSVFPMFVPSLSWQNDYF